MRSDADDAKKTASSWKVRVCGIFALCLLLLPGLPSCRKPHPPDLRRCTHVVIQYRPSALSYFFHPGDKRFKNLLSPGEKEYLKSLDGIVVGDQEILTTIAQHVGLGSYTYTIPGEVGIYNSIDVACYRNSKRLALFTVYGASIRTDKESHWFQYTGYPLGIPTWNLTPEIWPFVLRRDCAERLWYLARCVDVSPRTDDKHVPGEWCDVVKRVLRSYKSTEDQISKIFKCPSAAEGECHYAMNLNFKADSPPDTVLLFEAKAGWNQHGGPELFTFDNHEPRGGCVKLNDGSVKFIRTKEELEQLRWKE